MSNDLPPAVPAPSSPEPQPESQPEPPWGGPQAPSDQPPAGQPYGQPPAGQPQYGQPQYGVPSTLPPNHPSSTLALVLGILSLVCLGFLAGIPAMILGRKAVREIDASQGQLGGRGNAQAGFVTGLIGSVWTGLVFLFVVAVFIFGSLVASSFDDDDCSIQGDVPTYNC